MKKTASSLPPGPPFPGWVQAALLLMFWPRFVGACARRYGSVFTLRIPFMGTLVYLADPAATSRGCLQGIQRFSMPARRTRC
jgi:hypothetical protein